MKFLSLCTAMLFCLQLSGQALYKLAPAADETLPGWAVKMYGTDPNVYEIDDEYRAWRKEHPSAKTTYTQYYKKWRRASEPHIQPSGFILKPSPEETLAFQQRMEKLRGNNTERNEGAWQNIGPVETFNTNTGPSPLAKSSQVNIYCIDQTLNQPNKIVCGTEGGEIYVSYDKGQTWDCRSRNYAFGSITALESFTDESSVMFAAESNNIHMSLNGGTSWQLMLTDDQMWTNEIKVSDASYQRLLAATQRGLYRTNNGGENWERLLDVPCYDIEWKTDDPSVGFLVANDPVQNICRFYKSTDYGETWQLKDNGWFFSNEEGRNDGGAKIAVTQADPNRIYAVLIGEAKTGDSGFIGIWRSDDAGETWYMPNPPAGGPWDEVMHPNMATIGRTGGYHQGFYNLGFDVSDSDPDFIMAGFLNLWISIDGGYTFSCDGGYCGNNFNYVHPDCQEIEINDGDIWMTSDGGIEYSNDHFVTHYARNRGITGSDYWGFGAGWNEDILVGGRYHNGNSAWHENWMPGEQLSLGGGEAPTGYVNPGEGRQTYYSDLGKVVLPELQNGFAQYSGFGQFPNESYYDAESGEMEFDPRCWNHIYVTRENKIWKTTDGGTNFNVLHEFGTDVNARAMSFEISRSNPDVMYLFQRDENSWDPGLLWKTTDGGETWENLAFPQGYARRGVLAVDAENENRVWLAFPDGGDGEKIFTSSNGGQTWDNLTTAALNGEHITYIMHQGGTDGGIYLGTYRAVWFRDDSMTEWLPFNEGLPKSVATCILRPFYRDHKIRMGAYSKGLWETPFAVTSRPVAQPMAHKLFTSCPGDSIRFDDYSMLSHEGATWSWSFPGGTPSTSNARNPKVVYSNPGVYDVTLTVENAFGSSTKTVNGMITIDQPVVNEVPPLIDFSSTDHFTISNPDNGITWSPVNLDACNPDGDIAYWVNNYDYSSYGTDELYLPLNMDLTQVTEASLHFNVAYAPYYDGNAFIDSFKVMLSNNCGNTYHILFNSGGEALSTTSTGEGPNNLYEYERFSPQNCEEWRPVELDLSAYAGQYVTIKFVNQSGYGNNLYLDNIWLETILTSAETAGTKMALTLAPNPTNGYTILSGEGLQLEEPMIEVISVSGQTLLRKSFDGGLDRWQEALDLSRFEAGVYLVKIISEQQTVVTEKLVKM